MAQLGIGADGRGIIKYLSHHKHRFRFNEGNNKPLSRECMIYKKYKENGFKDVRNIHAFMKSIQAGTVGRKRPVKEDIPYEIIL